tara:strand:+ start:717 stop:875 length:159 start_codon:yes stop_codon:yes gene_type:complete
MTTIEFIPLVLATLALAIVAFSRSNRKKEWLIVAFVIWISIFFGTLVRLGVI